MFLLRPCISSPAWEHWSVLWWLVHSCQRAAAFWAPTGPSTHPLPWTCSTSAAVSLGMEQYCTTFPSIPCTLRVSSSRGCPMLSGSWLLSMWVHGYISHANDAAEAVQCTLVWLVQSNSLYWTKHVLLVGRKVTATHSCWDFIKSQVVSLKGKGGLFFNS